ncbi:uncharacterized protein LOC142164283 [Nicotiana tabacum]|uniref:Uncharacterized protein LOC142164283 n=1 Tax=Nicotiana tabacum TaxID=4097 RepID=A0AC58RZF5_TOBAC
MEWEQIKEELPLGEWKALTVGKQFGGLGIGNLKIQSKALRMKWLWRLSNEDQLLWGNNIKAKYGQEDKWMTKEVTTPYRFSPWRSIRSMWSELRDDSKIKVFDGNKTRFWKDNWHGVGILDVAFLEVFNLALH